MNIPSYSQISSFFEKLKICETISQKTGFAPCEIDVKSAISDLWTKAQPHIERLNVAARSSLEELSKTPMPDIDPYVAAGVAGGVLAVGTGIYLVRTIHQMKKEISDLKNNLSVSNSLNDLSVMALQNTVNARFTVHEQAFFNGAQKISELLKKINGLTQSFKRLEKQTSQTLQISV